MATVSYETAEKIWTTEIDDKILDTSSPNNRNFALFSRTGLLQIIDKYVDLSKIKSSSKQIYVTSYNTQKMFAQAHHLNKRSIDEMKKLLCATSAIPVAFQPEDINGDIHFDGGLLDNVPIKPLIKEKCTHALIIYLDNHYSKFCFYYW